MTRAPRRQLLWLPLAAACLLAAGGEAATPQGPAAAGGGRAQGVVDRAARFLGSPYRRDPLGEGPDGDVDRDPRLDVRSFDCVTLIEHALAFAIAGDGAGDEEVVAILDRIRYRAGEVGFRTRHHFFVADWIPGNAWLVEDVTASVGGRAARLLTRRVGRRAFFRAHGVEALDVTDEELSTPVIPAPAVAAVADRLEAGMIVVLIGRKKGLFARHAGLLVAGTEGGWLLRHASPWVGVVDEELLASLERAGGRLRGVKLLRIVE